MPEDIEFIAVLDKEKLPEDVRKIIEERFSKDLQDKIFDMIKKPNNKSNNIKDNKLFAIQTGTVVGNIYTDNKDNKEEYIKK